MHVCKLTLVCQHIAMVTGLSAYSNDDCGLSA